MSAVFTEFHTDPLGQEIRVGSKVVWVGGKTQYAGVRVFEVIKLTPKMVRIATPTKWDPDDSVVIDPHATLVVDVILEAQNKD